LIEDAKGECTERLEIFDQAEYLRRTGNLSLSPSEVRNLSIDLNKVLEGLPPELRALCKRLETETITEISQSTGVPRTTIYDSIKTIRAILEKAALQEYL
jgi:RNA polymerase sigma-70 factor (ECF subfamily)